MYRRRSQPLLASMVRYAAFRIVGAVAVLVALGLLRSLFG
jgi:hypothetical protein